MNLIEWAVSAVSTFFESSDASSNQTGFEWHNAFGTLADYQVPAEADLAAFNSWDGGSHSPDYGCTFDTN